MKKVVIYGTGKVGKAFYESHNFEGEELVAFVETNPNKESFLGTNIIGIEDIGENIDIIYLANSYIDTVYECIGRGIQKQRLILENEMLCKLYCSIEGTLDIKYDYIFAMKYERQITKKDEYIVMAAMQRNLKNYGSHKMNILGNSYTESYDYNRLATLELLIEEIKQNNINGELAELGVFKGNFSKWINKEFPDKRLFLQTHI
jgi:O-methyltransferase